MFAGQNILSRSYIASWSYKKVVMIYMYIYIHNLSRENTSNKNKLLWLREIYFFNKIWYLLKFNSVIYNIMKMNCKNVIIHKQTGLPANDLKWKKKIWINNLQEDKTNLKKNKFAILPFGLCQYANCKTN